MIPQSTINACVKAWYGTSEDTDYGKVQAVLMVYEQLRTDASEGVPVAWDFPFRDEPAYPGDTMRTAIYCADEAQRLRDKGYAVRDLYTHPPEVARDAGRLDWLEQNDEPAIEGPFPHLFPSERWLVRYRNKTTSRHATIREAVDAAISGAAGDGSS